jgi:serine O-acetyltransferase
MSELRSTLEADLGRRDGPFVPRLFWLLLFARGARGCLAWRRLGEFFRRNRLRVLASLCTRVIERRYGCYLSPRARIGPGLRLPHPVGIVIGEGVVIGEGCTIYQHVTIGARRRGDWQRGLYPFIGDNVVLFAGAVLAGAIRVGDRSTIGANAVVLDDVPPESTAVGNPARVLAKAPAAPAQLAQLT